jgi:MauM/NapG family ferredoxin protein
MARKSLAEILKDIFRPTGAPSSATVDKRMDRRRFFRHGLAEAMKPLGAVIRPLENMAHEMGKLDRMQSPPPKQRSAMQYERPWLRPPGAMPEGEFRLRCTKCGDCVNACPVHAIQVDHAGVEGSGYPYIDVNTQPCTLCDGQPCMPACPTGALQIVPLEMIDMGTANYFDQTCLRFNGEDCTACVDHCPVGSTALEIRDGWVTVHEEGCTGCGVCQSNCPTDPKSIIVIPKSSRND